MRITHISIEVSGAKIMLHPHQSSIAICIFSKKHAAAELH